MTGKQLTFTTIGGEVVTARQRGTEPRGYAYHPGTAASVRRLETRDTVPEWFAKLAEIYSKHPKVWKGAQ